jgi:hypothetical protein
MNFRDVLAIIDREENLPIKPEFLVRILKAGGLVEEVVFIGVELDTEVLKGKFVRVHIDQNAEGFLPRPYAIPENGDVVKVYYDRNMAADERRLVINKELLHIIDPQFVRTTTREKAAKLVHDLKLPRELMVQKVNGDNLSAVIDYISDFRAVGAMVPLPVRTLICENYAAGKIDEGEISRFTGIPRRYVSLILVELWENMREMFSLPARDCDHWPQQ